jgi:nickel/cobalt exporter
MSVTRPGGRTGQVAKLVIAVAAILLMVGVLDAVLAQTPFGAPKGAPTPSPDGILGWIFAKQNEFYRQFSALIRAAKADGSAVWGLLGVAFLYGVFHAAGPGHGKAVISSYVIANDETWRRGVVLSFASALLQAAVAVAVVAVFAALLRATASTMRAAVDVIEIVSYAFIILIGLRLLWVKGRAFFSTWQTIRRPVSEVGAAVTPADHLIHDHAHHDHSHHDHAHHDHDHAAHAHGHEHHDHAHHAPHDHKHDDHRHDSHGHQDHGHHHDHDHGDASAWGHAHAPEPEELAGPGGWKRGLSAIIAVGLRPCSGAIIVLVFALAQGLFWTGVAATFVMGLGTAITVAAIATVAVGARAWAQRFASTRAGYGMLAMRGVEVGAALVIIGFGALLLMGYMTSERLIGV